MSKSTHFIDNEIVGNEDCQVCVVDLVSISTESIAFDLLGLTDRKPKIGFRGVRLTKRQVLLYRTDE